MRRRGASKQRRTPERVASRERPDPPAERGCHRCGFDKKCRDLVVSGSCERWMQVQGINPNTGEPVNDYRCIDDWGPVLLIENSQQQRQTAAAIESFRNEMVLLNQPRPHGSRPAIAKR